MPSGIALAQAEIPLASSQSETGQAPVVPSVMQLPGPHDVSGQPNELGVSVGKGMAPVPRKLAERIWRWEFVEMSEMVAESWSQKVDEISAGGANAISSQAPSNRASPMDPMFYHIHQHDVAKIARGST